jgi:hypothetical protein
VSRPCERRRGSKEGKDKSKSGRRFHMEIAGIDRTGPMKVPNTGGWQVWER